MRKRGALWKRIRRYLYWGAGLSAVVGAVVWWTRPGLASDFGIIPFGKPPVTEAPPSQTPAVRHKKRVFPGPKFWRDGPPHLSTLQTAAVQVWNDLTTDAPGVVPVQDRLETVATHVDGAVKIYMEPVMAWVLPPLNRVWWYFVPAVPYCQRFKCITANCGVMDGDKDDRPCPQHPLYAPAVPEPDVWTMMIVGVALVGARLRTDNRRSTARA
jgi:hypothetical protein